MAELGIISTHGVEGWGRVMGEDKVIQDECVEGEGRGLGMTPAENCHFRDWAGKDA